MKKINFSDYVFHGLGGMSMQFEKREDEERRLSNKLRNAILSEIVNFDTNYDKDTQRLKMPSNGIVSKFQNYIKDSKINDSNLRMLFEIHRLIKILKEHKIKTFEDVLKEQNPLLINDEKQLGSFNNSDIICFIVKGTDNPWGAWRLFIEDAISIVLPYDNCFNTYKKSDDMKGIFRSELRIKGSIENPNIYAVSLPVTYSVGNSLSRCETMKYWLGAIEFIRQLLNTYSYKNVCIVDSMSGYDLENKEVINAYAKVINDSQHKFEKPNDGLENSFDKNSFFNGIIAYEKELESLGLE